MQVQIIFKINKACKYPLWGMGFLRKASPLRTIVNADLYLVIKLVLQAVLFSYSLLGKQKEGRIFNK